MNILSDSQAALQALANIQVTSKSVGAAIKALTRLGSRITVYLNWIKAHVNHPGNEKADQLAKEGSQLKQVKDYPLSQQACKTMIDEYIYAEWNKRWAADPTCRQTRIFFPSVNKGVSKKLLALDRVTLSNCVQVITGHNFLNRHNSLIDNSHNKLCRLCELEPESGSHIITDCEVLWPERADAFKQNFLDPDVPKWDVWGLVNFLGSDSVSPLFLNDRE